MRRPTPHDLLRLGWGAALLVLPDRCARLLGRTTLDGHSRTVVRALGARHVLQGLVLSARGTDRMRRLGRVVDLLHATSMGLLAITSPSHERLALTDAILEIGLAEPSRDQVGRPRT